MRRIRARLSTIDQLEAFLFWPSLTVALWIIFLIMCLVNGGPSLVFYGLFAILCAAWCIWRMVTTLRRAARWRPPPWRYFCQEMQDITDFYALDAQQFRSLLMWLWHAWGYECRPTGEGGVFVLLWPDEHTGELRWVAEMQCRMNPVVLGTREVQQFIRHIYQLNHEEVGGYLVTPYRFDLPARVLGARTPNIQLVDGEQVVRWLMRRSGELRETPQEVQEDISMQVNAKLSLIS